MIQLEETRRRLLLQAREADRQIVLQAPAGLTIHGDPQRLTQALTNLLSNALRHGSGDITLSAQPVGDRIQLCVRDRGPGLPEPFLPFAFDRFARANHAVSADGAGLGLPIVRAIAHAHKGSAGIRNHHHGAEAWLLLPADPPADGVSDPPQRSDVPLLRALPAAGAHPH